MKRSEKEKTYLREVVGADGTNVHYTGGAPDQRRELARKYRSLPAPGKKKATQQARATKQVAEMRATAALGAAVVETYATQPGMTHERASDLKQRYGIGRDDPNYINPTRK